MALEPEEIHYRKAYCDMIRELPSSSNTESLLKKLATQDNQEGSALLVDSIGNADDATSIEARAEESNQKLKDAGTLNDFAEFSKLMTPQTDIIQSRTQLTPKTIKAGHTFARNQKMMSVVDPTNPKVNALWRDIVLQEDRRFITGLSAPTVNRVSIAASDETVPTAITFPVAQEYETLNIGYLDVDDFELMAALFADNYINSQKFILMGTAVKAKFVNNNREFVKNGDFVNNKTFENGDLADISGFTPIVHPLVAADKFYCFTPDALLWNQFEAFDSTIDRIALLENRIQAFMVESADCQRLDDKGVIHGTIKAA